MTRHPAAPLDRAARFLTGFVVLVLAAVGALGVVATARVDGGARWSSVVVVVLAAGVLGLAWAYAPAGYEVGPGELRVLRRAMPPKRYRAANEPARPYPPGLRGIRLVGSGGFVGWYGLFWSRDLGRYRAHATDRGRTVLVRTTGLPVLVSPADPDAFVAASTASAP